MKSWYKVVAVGALVFLLVWLPLMQESAGSARQTLGWVDYLVGFGVSAGASSFLWLCWSGLWHVLAKRPRR